MSMSPASRAGFGSVYALNSLNSMSMPCFLASSFRVLLNFSEPTTPMVTFFEEEFEVEPQAAMLKIMGTAARAAANFFTAMNLSVE